MEDTTEVPLCPFLSLQLFQSHRFYIKEYCKKRLCSRPEVHDKLQDGLFICHLALLKVPVCTA